MIRGRGTLTYVLRQHGHGSEHALAQAIVSKLLWKAFAFYCEEGTCKISPLCKNVPEKRDCKSRQEGGCNIFPFLKKLSLKKRACEFRSGYTVSDLQWLVDHAFDRILFEDMNGFAWGTAMRHRIILLVYSLALNYIFYDDGNGDNCCRKRDKYFNSIFSSTVTENEIKNKKNLEILPISAFIIYINFVRS